MSRLAALALVALALSTPAHADWADLGAVFGVSPPQLQRIFQGLEISASDLNSPPRATPLAAPAAATSTAAPTLKSGDASWYGPGFHGNRTANGEIYDQEAMTAAMTGVPLGIRVRVVRRDTGASVEVRVNDRGPYQWRNDPNGRSRRRGRRGTWDPHPTRVIDLSRGAMRVLGGIDAGTIAVDVYRIGGGQAAD